MAAQVGALRVTVGADITGLQAGMRRAERQVAKSAGTMQKAVKDIDTSFRGLGTVAGLSLGGAGLLAGASAFLKIADAAKSLTAQLKLATAEYGSFQQANKDVRVIAEATRSDLLATAELYAALQRNSGQLGTTQAEVARATQTVAEAFKISGAATSEQSAATRQLIQAFQSGVLRGDEFNSVMENAPRLAKLIADSLGVTVGALREMAHEGELTSDKLVKAFTDKKFTEGLDAEFKQLPITFDESMTQLYNAAVVVFSAFDQGGQFSTNIANFVVQGTDGFAKLEEGAFSFGQKVSDTLDAVDQVRQALNLLQTDGVGSFFGLTNATYSWRDALADTLGVLDGVANAVVNLFNAPSNFGRLALGQQPIVDPVNMRGSFLNRVNQKDLEAGYRRINSKSVADILADAGMSPKAPPPYRPPAGKPKKPKKGRGPKAAPRDRSDDVEFQFAQELRQAQMDVLQAQRSLAGSFEERTRLSLEILAMETQSKQAELDDRVRRAERDFAEKKITAGALEQVRSQAKQLQSEYAKEAALKKQEITLEQELHNMERADKLAQRGYEDQLAALEFADDIADTQEEHRRIQLQIVDTIYDQKEAHLRALKAQLELAGKIEEAADVQAEINRLGAERARDKERARDGTKGPMESYKDSLPITPEKWNEELENIEVGALKALEDGLVDIVTGAKSVKEAFHDMANQIIADLIRIAIRRFIISPGRLPYISMPLR